ncbi:MAG: hypothetical protein J0L77_05060 [Alphaproteobacteria bacterium]|nr:hypothetical protein [Alphaproteobacteria bacterium]
MDKRPHISWSESEKARLRGWLSGAFAAAQRFDGSEAAMNALLMPLAELDSAVRAKNNGQSSEDIEQSLARELVPDMAADFTVAHFMVQTSRAFFARLQSETPDDVLSTLSQGGAVVMDKPRMFVKTDSQSPGFGMGDGHEPYRIKTSPRLAILCERLGTMGVYLDDLIIHPGTVDPNILRELPYTLVQIPKMNAEISICDQVGQVTFISTKILGPTLWENLSKDELKARPDIVDIPWRSDAAWWDDISSILSTQTISPEIRARSFAKKPEPLDLELIRRTILATRLETGKWPTQKAGLVQYGPYADGKTKFTTLLAALRNGRRGLLGSSSLSEQCAILSEKHGLDYINHLNQHDFDLGTIRETILKTRQQTGRWPTQKSGLVKHGPYANGRITFLALGKALSVGSRGLTGGSSLPQECEYVSNQFKLNYVNVLKQSNYDLNKIRETIFETRRQTGKWPSMERGLVKYGPYADGKTKFHALNAALKNGLRGLPGGSSIADQCSIVSEQFGLDYFNIFKQPNYDLEKIREILLKARMETGRWPTRSSGLVQYEPYADGKTKYATFDAALRKGRRGLSGRSSLSQECAFVSKRYGLDYINLKAQPSYNLEIIHETILKTRQATGQWPKMEWGLIQHGLYADGKTTFISIDSALRLGIRGLKGGSSLARECLIVSDKNNLDYRLTHAFVMLTRGRKFKTPCDPSSPGPK